MLNIKEKGKKIREEIVTIWLVLRASETPFLTKILAFLAVAYAISPIDLIPDFIPVLGYLDDLLILPMLIFVTMKTIPKGGYEKYKVHSKDIEIEPRWYYTIPIIVIWIVIILCLISLIRKSN